MDNNRKDMKDKYYTPELTEFRIGFRYERMNGERWEKAVIAVNDLSSTSNYYKDEYFENEFEEIVKGMRTVRVAYLCEEDILSLGFICFDKYSYYIIKDNETYHLGYPKLDDKLIILKLNKDNEIHCLFYGQVKNINELEVILKQVGI